MAPVNGGNGNDILMFQGSQQHVTATFVNPYSGRSVSVDDDFNVNQTSYNGMGGTDVLSMTAQGDFLTLNDGNGNPTLISVERIIAGAGGDALILSDAILTLGNTLVSGGDSDDIIWTNVGNDTVNAGNGNDIVEGGAGNDTLNGENDNDTLYGDSGDDRLNGGAGNDTAYGGTGNDIIIGGDGDDTLYGDDGPNSNPNDYAHTQIVSYSFTAAAFNVALNHGANVYVPPENQGIQAIAINYATTVTATFVYSEAGYDNSLGFYRIGADGSINDVSIVLKNQHDATAGQSFDYTYNGHDGDTLGTFIIANGINTDNAYRNADLTHGNLQFIYDFGLGDQHTATVNDDGHRVSLVFSNGNNSVVFDVNAYHSSLAGGASTLNEDGIPHVISGLADGNDAGSLRIAFEDLYYLGDADFNDVVYDIHVASQQGEIFGAADNDYIVGGAGDDVLYGGFGNDTLVAGLGADHLYGGDGSDIFAFDTIDGFKDTIHDFHSGHGGDILNLTAIVSGYDATTSAIEDFVRITHNSSNDDVYVNSTGAAGGTFQLLATISGGTGGLDAAALAADGNLVLNQNVIV